MQLLVIKVASGNFISGTLAKQITAQFTQQDFEKVVIGYWFNVFNRVSV
jgi:hypothetical protein